MFGEKKKALLLLIGLLVLAAGLLFVGQGSGWIQWPAESFMISQIRWIYYGAAIAAFGVVLIILARL
jgi:hypothetical protein